MSEPLPGRKAELATIAAVTYLASFFVLIVPAFIFALGVQASGAAAGLWRGDANSDDGEETWALAFGAVLITVVLLVAALVLRWVARKYSLSAVPVIAVGTLVMVILIAALCVVTVLPVS